MDESVIDQAVYAELQETTGAEFVAELVDTFLEEASGMLTELRRARAENHADRFRRAAHSLKSNSNTFGALALGAMARELELAGVASVIERGGQPLDALAQEYARVAAALTEMRHA